MSRDDECDELCALLRSRFPIILIVSNEEPRILDLLQKAANLENQVLMTWSITHGIRRYGRDEAIYQTNDLLDALKHIDKTPQNGVYVMCDAHPGFKDPVSMRLIREIALSHYRSARTLVFVSPRLDEMPPEILRLSAHFHPKLPNRDEIRALVAEEARRYESQSGEKPRGDRHALEMLVMHLLGMEQDDVRRLVRQALRDDGTISADDVRRVLATKYEALGGAGTLAYEESKVRFDDVGGLAQLKHWVSLRRKPFLGNGEDIDRPKGIVLLGVQGGGKSLAARAIAGEWGVPLMRMDFGALYNKYYGETERNLRNAFAAAESMSPCVLWIDEIEKGISTDSGEGDGGVSRRVLGTMLTWMAERKEPVFMVATSNDISQLPPELVRKGRFDEIFFVDFPQLEARRQIARIHLKKRGHDPAQFDVDGFARLADGFSGAEIEQAIVSASFEARSRNESLASADILAELERTRPLAVVMAEKIDALRDWASGRAVYADEPETPA
ncbi:MAG TPA: AAA family ATPase [Burkholderiaceae bacterium]|nr:AAA family ATPase [Burkholderiaceae bacterium]HQR71570.1 AAA family ATPase [Burkholderiaceae bacterium]